MPAKKKKSETVVKPSNPKAATGIKKVPMSCLSSQVIGLVAEAFMAESIDLDDANYFLTEHFSQAVKNLMDFWEGYNDELTVPHLARAMAHMMIIRAAEWDETLEDDRAFTCDINGIHVASLNEKAAEIIKKYPDCVDPYTEKPAGTLGFKVAPIENPPLDVLPWRVVMEIALGMMEGGRKYGRHNYRSIGVRASVYYDATMRHLADYYAGKAVDKDSGLSHLTKALSSSQVLLDAMVMGNWVDDRPIRIK